MPEEDSEAEDTADDNYPTDEEGSVAASEVVLDLAQQPSAEMGLTG